MIVFQHTAARRRLDDTQHVQQVSELVSTHSRPKAAGPHFAKPRSSVSVSTHSRPKAAGLIGLLGLAGIPVSTHSRPKAAGKFKKHACGRWAGFNTQPPEGGWEETAMITSDLLRFQHTAARRRLAPHKQTAKPYRQFQHTAARRRLVQALHNFQRSISSFNTQPPEGGWRRLPPQDR